MPLVAPKPIAVAVANLVRGTALSQFSSWRPFAYKFDSKASILTVESVKEDPISIHSAFSSLDFDRETASLDTILSETYEINGEFNSKLLSQKSGFNVRGDSKLLTSLSPMSLKVFYLYSSGVRSEESNRALLQKDSNLVVFSSRHTVIEEISFAMDPRPDGDMDIIFKCSNPDMIDQACLKLSELFKV